MVHALHRPKHTCVAQHVMMKMRVILYVTWMRSCATSSDCVAGHCVDVITQWQSLMLLALRVHGALIALLPQGGSLSISNNASRLPLGSSNNWRWIWLMQCYTVSSICRWM